MFVLAWSLKVFGDINRVHAKASKHLTQSYSLLWSMAVLSAEFKLMILRRMTTFMQITVTGSTRLLERVATHIHAEAESSTRLQLLRTNIFLYVGFLGCCYD